MDNISLLTGEFAIFLFKILVVQKLNLRSAFLPMFMSSPVSRMDSGGTSSCPTARDGTRL